MRRIGRVSKSLAMISRSGMKREISSTISNV
nr:MAG TPA: hypothetical protein [Bacteriophage sp.]